MFEEKVDKKIIILLITVTCLFYLLNILYPLFADDYFYSYITGTGEKVSTFKDIVKSQYIHYFTWGGRSLAHFIGQFFLWKGKGLFNVFNSIIFLVLIIYIHKNLNITVKNTNKKITYLFIIFLLWFGIPEFGETTIWLIGSVNYLWMLSLLLITLYVFKVVTYSDVKLPNITVFFLLILGILAGWTNENNVVAFIFILGIIIVFKKKTNKYNISLFIGLVVGGILLIMAPGNFERSKVFNYHPTLLERVSNYLDSCWKIFEEQCVIWIILLLLLLCLKLHKKKIVPIICKFKLEFSLFVFSMLAMLASPIFPTRASFGSTIFLIIFVGNLFLEVINIENNKLKIIIYYGMILILLVSYVLTLKEYINLKKNSIQREEIIFKSDKNYVVMPEFPTSKRHLLIRDGSLKKGDLWINEGIQKYYNINKVMIIDRDIYEKVYEKKEPDKSLIKINNNDFRISDFVIKDIYILSKQKKYDYIVLFPIILDDKNKIGNLNELKVDIYVEYKKSNGKVKNKNFLCEVNPVHIRNLDYQVCNIRVKSLNIEKMRFSFYNNGSLINNKIELENVSLKERK